MKIYLLAAVLGVSQLANALPGLISEEHYNNSLTLDPDGNYLLLWNFNDTHVTFEVRVKTRGYVGFGLSPNGNMFPSDVVVGWVKDGKVYFKDRHTIGHSPPIVDKSQDWFLLHGEENDFGTVLKFVRKLNTCDNDDMEINKATQRLIYSYHPDDPADEDSLTYHGGERRGTKSVALLNLNKPAPDTSHEEVIVYDLTAENYVVPAKDTTYYCIGHQMSDLGRKHHLIEFEPIFTPGNERLIHHLVIQRCPGNHPELHGAKAECFGDWPHGWPACPEIFIAWATGGGPFYFPANAGYSVNGPDDLSFLVMQIHYDNPSLKSGVIDNSGIRMRLTPTLRQHDAGSLLVGHTVVPFQVIPPHEPVYVTNAYCTHQCLSKSMERKSIDEVRAVAVLQHAHLLAAGIKTRHFRNGTELPPVYDDPHYDFYFQEFRPLPEERVIKKGDSMKVECTYTTKKNNEPAFGGLTTRDEMCESIMYIYPKLDLLECTSFPNMTKTFNQHFKFSFKDGPGTFQSFMRHQYDWSNSTERTIFQKQLEGASVVHLCGYNSHNDTLPAMHDAWEFVEDDSDKIPYIPPPSECDVTKQHP